MFSKNTTCNVIIRVWSENDLSLVEENQVWEHLNQTDRQKFMGYDEVPLGVKELADLIASPLSIISEGLWQLGEGF